MIGWEDYTLMMSFVLMGFPYKDQIEELFIVLVHCMYSQQVTTFDLYCDGWGVKLYSFTHASH